MEAVKQGFYATFALVILCGSASSDRGRVYMVASPKTVSMPINDETELTCEMNLQPDRFQWRHYPLDVRHASDPKAVLLLRNATFVDLSPEMYTSEKKRSTLKIKPSNKEVAGDYQCLAHYGASVVASVPGRVTLTTLGKFPEQSNIEISISAGNTISWRCEEPISNPPAAIDYYKNGNYIRPQTSLPRTKSLIISNSEVDDSGRYTCEVSNVINTHRSHFYLDLRVVPSRSSSSPKFIIRPKQSYTVNKDDTAFMDCSAVGTPTPKVVWFKSNGQLPPNRTKMVPGGLLIYNVSSSDDGVYVCNHTNSLGAIAHHITLIYNEAPSITDGPQNADIKEGENLDLECEVEGTPEPLISWFLNGRSVINDSFIEAIGNRIYFRPIEKRHAGILQCFASNAVATVYSSANLKVIPKEISSSDVIEEYIPPPTIPVHKKRKHNKKRKGHKGTAEMIPPSRPTVTHLNDQSVMVRWSVPVNNGLPIQFFKVQYQEQGPANQNCTPNATKKSRWKTREADIAPHIFSYEVNNLKASYAYRFRIAAVYSNNDNKLGNSTRFCLKFQDFFLRNSLPVPKLVNTETVNATAIQIYWQLAASNSSVDGFYVHYIAATNAGDYMKATVDGENLRSYVITHLMPNMVYEIKLQSFTTDSASEFSPILKQRTARLITETTTITTTTIKSSSETAAISQMDLYIGVGVSGLFALVCVVGLLIFCRRCKQNKEKDARGDDHRNKEDDVSHHIQADGNDYVVSPKSVSRANGCVTPPNRITITSNPLADADNKNQNMIEMSCLSSQNNNCSVTQPSASSINQESLPNESLMKGKIKNRDKRSKISEPTPGENYV